jgi:hypothetical protein
MLLFYLTSTIIWQYLPAKSISSSPAHAPLRHCARFERSSCPRSHSVRVAVIEKATHRVVVASVSLYCTALSLRLLRQPRANAATGSPQRLSCNEAFLSPLSGLKRLPLRGKLFHIPTLHPGRAKRVLPLVGAVVPTLASPPAGASR